MPGSSRPREIARVADRDSLVAFLNEATGEYVLSRSERRWGIVARVIGAFIGVPMLIAMMLDGTFSPLTMYRVAIYAAAVALLAFGVVETIDFAGATIHISPAGIQKSSRVSLFAFSISSAEITHIALLEKGSSLYLSVHRLNGFARTGSLPGDARLALLSAAHGRDLPALSPAAQFATSLAASSAIGVAIGFVGTMIALPLYTEASHLVGVTAAILAVGSAALVSDRFASSTLLSERSASFRSTTTSRGRRATCAALAAFCCIVVLIGFARSSGAGV